MTDQRIVVIAGNSEDLDVGGYPTPAGRRVGEMVVRIFGAEYELHAPIVAPRHIGLGHAEDETLMAVEGRFIVGGILGAPGGCARGEPAQGTA